MQRVVNKKNPYISNLVRTWVVGSAFCLLDTGFWYNFGVLKPDRWCNSERARLEFMFLCCVVLCLYVPFKYLSFLAPNFFFLIVRLSNLLTVNVHGGG